MADQIPWSDDTEKMIGDLEGKISEKYSVSLRDLLLKPEEYANKEGINSKIEGIKADVNDYVSQLLTALSTEQETFTKDLDHANAQYQKVNDSISEKSKMSDVPYIVPVAINRNTDYDETIVIDEHDASVDSLIEKLIRVSNYVADISATYKTYKIGAWIFSGSKVYSLAVNPPVSPILAVETAGAEINFRLDMALQQ